jgi:hypothetical protein
MSRPRRPDPGRPDARHMRLADGACVCSAMATRSRTAGCTRRVTCPPKVGYGQGMHLASLSSACLAPGTETSQRFLASAYDSVDAVFDSLAKVRDLRKQQIGDIRGRLPANEEDLLRAAIVFTGAGMDATIKRLIRDTLPDLLESNVQAQDKFQAFAADRLGTGEFADTRMLARYLTSSSPRQRLIEDYIYALTGSSLQSAEEVQRAAGALGINDGELRRQITGLQKLFIARNEISHELDLQRPERQGDRARRTRGIPATRALCHGGLEIGQLVINAVGALLGN